MPSTILPTRLASLVRRLGVLVARLATALAAAQTSRAAPSPPAATPAPVWGIGDQHSDFFDDPRWRQLPLRHVRYFLPWDLAHEHTTRDSPNHWLATARAHHAIPLLRSPDVERSFGTVRRPGRPAK